MSSKNEDKRKPSNKLLKVLSINVRSLRKAKGLSQEGLGELCNFHPTFISLVERSQRNVTISTLEIIATALGVQPYDLLMENP